VRFCAVSEDKIDCGRQTVSDIFHVFFLLVLNIRNKTFYTGSLVVVDVDALQLQVWVTVIGACRINTVLVRDHLPELFTNKQLNISFIDNKNRPNITQKSTIKQKLFKVKDSNIQVQTCQSVLKALLRQINFFLLPIFCKRKKVQRFTLAPIWLPHWPAWMCTISRILSTYFTTCHTISQWQISWLCRQRRRWAESPAQMLYGRRP